MDRPTNRPEHFSLRVVRAGGQDTEERIQETGVKMFRGNISTGARSKKSLNLALSTCSVLH